MEVLVEERGKERSSTNDPAVKAATRRSALSQVYVGHKMFAKFLMDSVTR